MGDWPNVTVPPPPVLTPYHRDMYGTAAANTIANLGAAASVAWTSANKAYFYPFRLGDFATAKQLLWFVGGTAAGNIDMGIYTAAGDLLVSSGITAMSATVSTVQQLNITDTQLGPGNYFLAFGCSSTSGTIVGTAVADERSLSIFPIYEQASAIALPNPATPVLCTDGSPLVAAVGIQFGSTF